MKLAAFARREDGAVAVIAGAALAAAQKLADSAAAAQAMAIEFAQKNVSSADGAVTTASEIALGQYDAVARAFIPDAQPYNAVKVRTRRTADSGNAVNTYFGGILGVESIDVDAEAIAVLSRPTACVYALQASGTDTFLAGGSGAVRVPNCPIQVNSTGEPALKAGGASTISAKSICAPGGYSGHNIDPTPETDCELDPDPMAGVSEPPPPASCYMEDVTIASATVLPPGKYCGDIKITSGAQVTLEPGIFYFENAVLTIDGSAAVEGEEVMFFFDRHSEFFLTATDILLINPPTSGTWRGISIFQSRKGSTIRNGTITGDRELRIGGTIYVPKLDLYMTGNSALYATMEVGYVIANTFEFNGSSEAVLDMTGGAVPSAYSGTVSLVR